MPTPTPYYADDLVTLYHGDALQAPELLAAADVLVSDPPYGIAWHRPARLGGRHDGIANDHDTSTRDAAHEAFGTSKPAIQFGSPQAPYPADVRQVLAWHKPGDTGVLGSATGFRRDLELIFLSGQWPKRPVRHSSVMRTEHRGASRYLTGHPHSKPVDLVRALIDATPDGVIVDPFAGSGSTLVAAILAGRQAIGFELDEKYCVLAASRLRQVREAINGQAQGSAPPR